MNYLASHLTVPVSVADHIRGNPSAAVTLLEYGDYQCPACGDAYPLIKQLQQTYVEDLCVAFRNFPMTQSHPLSRLAAEIAEAAGTLGEFWPMHDWLYEHQASWSEAGPDALRSLVRKLAIDVPAIEDALRDPGVDARISRDFNSGVRSGVNGTPGLFINGRLFQGDFEYDLAQAIESARDGG